MKWLTLFFTLTILAACNAEEQTGNEEVLIEDETAVTDIDTSKYTISVFPVEPSESSSEGFGFEITARSGQGLKIRQPNIPAIQGNQPFISEENARATAGLMIYKLEKRINATAISGKRARQPWVVVYLKMCFLPGG